MKGAVVWSHPVGRDAGTTPARLTSRVAGTMLLVVGLLVGLPPRVSAVPVTVTIDGVTYVANDANVAAGATVTAYAPGPTAVTVPETVQIGAHTYAVRTIGVSAFDGAGLASVTLPDSLVTIESFAFRDNSLTAVTLPAGLRSVGNSAFEDNALAAVTLPEGLESVGSSAFLRNALVSVSIPDSVTSVGPSAFQSNALETVMIGDGLTVLRNAVFQDNRISSVTFGRNVAALDGGAFQNNALTSLVVPGTVTSLGHGAFRYNALTTVDLGQVQSIAALVFDANELTTVVLPETVTSIGNNAFRDNPALTEVTFLGAAPSMAGSNQLGPHARVTYYDRFDAARVAGGFTRPSWSGYDTRALVLLDFDMNGHGTPVPPVEVPVDSVVAEPPAPTATGYVFTGWFTDAGATTAWDFSAPVTVDTTLVAGWTAAVPVASPVAVTTGAGQPVDVLLDGSIAGGGALVYAVGAPGDGTVTCAPVGGPQCTYTPRFGFAGTDAFGYGVTDVLGVTASSTVTVTVEPPTVTIDGITYVADEADPGAGATVTAYTGPPTVTIPDSVAIAGTTYAVRTIGDGAFDGVDLDGVTLPTSLHTVGYAAFRDTGLVGVTLPDGVVAVGESAFQHNPLVSVDLGQVHAVGARAFASASSPMTSLVVPATVTSIGDDAFDGPALTDVRFLGAAPSMAGSSPLGPAADITYYHRFDAATTAGGFTRPTWFGYGSQAVVVVDFDMNGYGVQVPSVELVADGPTSAPVVPTAVGMTFTGWFTDAAVTTAHDFSAPVTADTTLYAGWTAASGPAATDGLGATASGAEAIHGAGAGAGVGVGAAGSDALPPTGSAPLLPGALALVALVLGAALLRLRRS